MPGLPSECGPLAFCSQCLYAIDIEMSSECLYMTQRLKTAQVNLRISPELKKAAEKTAEADSRSLTSLVEKLLTDAATQAGYWPPKGRRK